MTASSLQRIPTEILLAIVAFLPRSSISELCLTSRQIYAQCLPALYASLELSFSFHIKQLVHAGHERRPMLQQVLERNTKHLHLICRESGSRWLVADLVDWIPNIHTLTFSDFRALPIEQVCEQILLFPHIHTLRFRCCNLTTVMISPPQQRDHHRHHDMPSSGGGGGGAAAATVRNLMTTRHLELSWTDFSTEALDYLLARLPNLRSIDFGANHNRDITANDLALRLLQNHCPRIRHLRISLQQQHHHQYRDSLCDLIAFYGPQLSCLDIRCDDPRIMNVIASHATGLRDLTIHAIGGPWQQLSISHKYILAMLRRCCKLTRFKMASWMVQDVPGIVWQILAKQKTDLRQLYYLDDHALCHHRAVRHRDIGCLNKTLTLGTEELHELRKVMRC